MNASGRHVVRRSPRREPAIVLGGSMPPSPFGDSPHVGENLSQEQIQCSHGLLPLGGVDCEAGGGGTRWHLLSPPCGDFRGQRDAPGGRCPAERRVDRFLRAVEQVQFQKRTGSHGRELDGQPNGGQPGLCDERGHQCLDRGKGDNR
jgi:hypothetical protein